MKKISVVLLVLCLTAVAAVSLGAQDTPWWTNRTIENLEFEDLVHVEPRQLDFLVEEYRGETLTHALFQEIQNRLYDLEYFSYFYAYAKRSAVSDQNVILSFSMVEQPLVTELTIDGNSVLSNQRIRELIRIDQGSFFSRSSFRGDPDRIKREYLDRGYADVTIDQEQKTDEEANTVSITYTIDEGLQSRIDQIAFQGNESFSDSTLKRQLISKEQSLFNRGIFIESQLDEDREAVLTFYRDRGYIDAEISDVSIEAVETDRGRKALSITFEVVEGPLWRFGGISISGNTLFSDEELKQNTRLRVGDTLNLSRLQEDFAAIVEVYYNSGYIYNEVTPTEQRDHENNRVTFDVVMVERGQAFIEDVTISGNERTRDNVISRELTLQPGEVFSRAELIQSMRNLYNTGLFDDVNVQPEYGSEEGLLDLNVDVIEANRIDLRFGATFGGGDFPVSGFLSWNDKNFFGMGSDFSISLEASPVRQSIDFTYMENWLFNRRLSGGVNLRFDRNKETGIPQDRTGSGFPEDSPTMEMIRYNIGLGLFSGYTFHTDIGRINIGGGYSFSLRMLDYDDNQYTPYNQSYRDNHQDWQFNNEIYLTTTWDRRDLVHNPTSGFILHNRIGVSGGVLNEAFFFAANPLPTNYIKNQTRLAGYFTLFDIPRTDRKNLLGVLSAETNFSFMFPQREAEGFADRSNKLFIDGMNTARGWDFDRNLEVLWDNKIAFTMPLVSNVLDAEAYLSATWGYGPEEGNEGTGFKTMGDDFGLDAFKFSTGAGIKLGIPGLPLGLFLTKAFEFDDGSINWEPKDLTQNLFGPLGLQLVFTIDYSLF